MLNPQRINLSVSKELYSLLNELAKKDHLPTARKTKELILKALETEEDVELEKIARERDKKSNFISHEKVWK